MKKFILPSTLGLSIFMAASTIAFTSCEKEENSSTGNKVNKYQTVGMTNLEIVITMGTNFTSDDGYFFECVGRNAICKVRIQFKEAYPYLATNEVYGKISKRDDGKLIMKYDKDGMTADQLKAFETGQVTLEEDKIIPLNVIKDLGFSSDYTILAGNYDYTDDVNYFVVAF